MPYLIGIKGRKLISLELKVASLLGAANVYLASACLLLLSIQVGLITRLTGEALFYYFFVGNATFS